jgi:superfamily II DNA or RNA helicase
MIWFMGEINLWGFQQNLITRLRQSLVSRFRAPLLVSPTGSGKTVMFAYLTKKLTANGYRTVILAHRKELLAQISSTLRMFHVKHSLIAPSVDYNDEHLVHVASVFSVVRRLHIVKCPDFVIIDEAHHCVSGSTWNKTLDMWASINPKLRVIGVTATPERLSGEGLDATFDKLVLGPTVAELISSGYLSPFKIFAPPQPVDTSQLHRRMGDYVKSEAADLMDKPKITGNAIDHYRKHLNGAPAVAFCVSIKHAHNVAEQFRSHGFKAVAIDGQLSDSERTKRTADFAAGRLNVMTSCDLISEGYDVPGMMGCINLRPTESLALCLQQWGRTLRYQNGKIAIILDHVANSARHGLPDTDRQWTLRGRDRKKRQRDQDDVAIRQCKCCGAVCNASKQQCPECGNCFPIKARKIKEVEGNLEEIKRQESIKFVRQRAAAKDLKALAEIGKMRGMKNPYGWARHVMAARERKRR